MNTAIFNYLETSRLRLREITPDVYIRVMSSYTDSDIMKFFGLVDSTELEDEKSRYKQGMTMAGKSFLYFHLIQKDSGEVMGWCGYHTWFTKHLRAELGYVLSDDKYKGLGYMKEALPLVLKYGFEKMKLHRIEALVSPDNIPSLKLLKHHGFRKEGTLREHYMKDGKLEDSVVFSLLNHEYKMES